MLGVEVERDVALGDVEVDEADAPRRVVRGARQREVGGEGRGADAALGARQHHEQAGGGRLSRSPPITRRIVCAHPPADMILPGDVLDLHGQLDDRPRARLHGQAERLGAADRAGEHDGQVRVGQGGLRAPPARSGRR